MIGDEWTRMAFGMEWWDVVNVREGRNERYFV